MFPQNMQKIKILMPGYLIINKIINKMKKDKRDLSVDNPSQHLGQHDRIANTNKKQLV